MRILLINKVFHIEGGSDTCFLKTAELLKSKGHKVSFFCMNHPKNYETEYKQYFITQINKFKDAWLFEKLAMPSRMIISKEANNKISDLIRKDNPDIVHIHNTFHELPFSIINIIKKFNIPIVLTMHDYIVLCSHHNMWFRGKVCHACVSKKIQNIIKNRCIDNSFLKSCLVYLVTFFNNYIFDVFNKIDLFIAPSLYMYIFFKNIKNTKFAKKLIYIPNFIEANIDWNSSLQEKIIVYIGRLTSDKGLICLIEAIRDIDVKLKIIGTGDYEDELKKYVKIKGISNVIFRGHLKEEDVKQEIRNCLFMVLPSVWEENCPLSILESFSLGKTVIGSSIGGIPELIKDNFTGLTFEPNNVQDLKIKIKYLLENPDKREEFGLNARKSIINNFSPDRHYELLLKCYNSLLN